MDAIVPDPLRVLLVEDSRVLTERLAEVIRLSDDVELVGAVDTEDGARAAVQHEPIDIMILDLHLKQGNGFGVLRGLRKNGARPYVVVLTNYDLPEYKSAALALGVTHFLDKLRDYDRLPEVLRELVARARMQA
jgi:DNA-binding NarL/FixJ family response regulator